MMTWRNAVGIAAASATLAVGAVGTSAQDSIFSDAANFKILWSPASGAHFADGGDSISQELNAAGHERGYSYPTTDEYYYGSEVRQRFSDGYTAHYSTVTKRTWVTR